MERSLNELAEEAGNDLRRHFSDWQNPQALVQTGSGQVARGLLDEVIAELPLDILPGMPRTASPGGHRLRLILGRCGERQILVAEGRRHLYEGFGVKPCVLPVCGAVKAGIRHVVLCCSAGTVNREFSPGTIIALTDYINNLGVSPLVGSEPLGASYFQAMNEAYSQRLVSTFLNHGPTEGMPVRLGIYQANMGPQYETPAEVDCARSNGADLVGMSMVPETIAARALGAEVLGLAIVTNYAACRRLREPTHAEVETVAAQAAPELMKSLNRFLSTNLSALHE